MAARTPEAPARARVCAPALSRSGALFLALFLALAALPAVAQPAEDADEPAWIQAKEDRARELVRDANAARQEWIDAGEVGPRSFQTTFREAADLLREIAAVAPTARRLYGLAFARFHAGEAERAHFACDRVAREFPAAADVIQRCEALTAVLHGEVYRVLVDSAPQDAAVTVEGWPEDEAFRTPGVVWLRAGKRTLHVSLEGYLPQSQSVTVDPGFLSQVRVQLQPIPAAGRLELVLQPERARVLVDGEPIVVPLNGIVELPAGTHVVRVEAEGFEPHEEHVTIAPGEMSQLWFELEPEPEDPQETPDRPYWDQPTVATGPGMSTLEIVGIVGMVVGSAAIVGGGVMHGLAFTKADEASSVPNLPQRRSEFESLRDEARTFELSAYALYGAGAAVLTGGVLLFVLDPGATASGEGTTIAPTALEGGFGFTWTGRF